MNNAEDQSRASHLSEHRRGSITDLLSSSSISSAGATEILTSPNLMAALFRTRLSWLFPEGAVLRECRPKVLMDRLKSRQVVSYRLIFSGDAAPATLVLKRYADKAKGKKTYAALGMLWNNGFNRESELRIPEPFSYLEDVGLLVSEKAQGMLLSKKLHRSGPVVIARMKAVARWLTKLHHLAIDLNEISPHPDEETSIRDFVRQVRDREPRLLPRTERLASAILMKLSSFKKIPMTLVHGDFQCDNIFVDKDSVTVIDFDKLCRSDPARDLGYMIAQMRVTDLREAVSYKSVHSWFRFFWDEYLAAAPEGERETLSGRASLFAARKCLQNIAYILAYMSPGEGMEIASVLLGEAERFSKADRMEEVLEIPIPSGH